MKEEEEERWPIELDHLNRFTTVTNQYSTRRHWPGLYDDRLLTGAVQPQPPLNEEERSKRRRSVDGRKEEEEEERGQVLNRNSALRVPKMGFVNRKRRW
jgi:hypothetical protein